MRKKTRAVLLGTNAYPLLMRYWFEIFTQRWQDEVDKVYIAISKPEHMSAWYYTKKMLQSHKKIEVLEFNTGWPDSINQAAGIISEDLIFVPHDDTFLLKPGVLDKYFQIIEDDPNTVVTPLTPIFTPKDTVEELMRYRYPSQTPFTVAETGETGYSWYCNMFFISRELLARTNRDFGEWHVKIGDYEPNLDWTPLASPFGADTNFKMTLELLRAGVKVHGIKKYELAHLYNEKEPRKALNTMIKEKQGVFSDEADYIHLQTMAYHIHGLYFDVGVREALEQAAGRKISRLITNRKAEVGGHAFTWDLTIKIAWLYEFLSVGDYSGMQKYHDHVLNELDYIIAFAKLSKMDIKYFNKVFHDLIWQKRVTK